MNLSFSASILWSRNTLKEKTFDSNLFPTKKGGDCTDPHYLDTDNGGLIMTKITDKERLEIYKKWKGGEGSIRLSHEYGIDGSRIRYLVRLIERHGPDILGQGKNRNYTKTFKEEVINKVLKENQAITDTSIEYGFSSEGTLANWIRSYKENGYDILEKKKGRPPMKAKETKAAKPYEEMTDAEKIAYLEERNRYLEAETE